MAAAQSIARKAAHRVLTKYHDSATHQARRSALDGSLRGVVPEVGQQAACLHQTADSRPKPQALGKGPGLRPMALRTPQREHRACEHRQQTRQSRRDIGNNQPARTTEQMEQSQRSETSPSRLTHARFQIRVVIPKFPLNQAHINPDGIASLGPGLYEAFHRPIHPTRANPSSSTANPTKQPNSNHPSLPPHESHPQS